MQGSIQLTVASDELARFCQQLVDRSRDHARTLDTLAGLEAFICRFGRSSQGTTDYAAVEALLRSFADQTRDRLLEQRTGELLTALGHRDPEEIVRIHAPLSRDGFYQILQTVLAQLPNEEKQSLATWSIDWSRTAKKQAEQASGYPDALDFAGAGIRPETYQAMLDVSRCLAAFAGAK